MTKCKKAYKSVTFFKNSYAKSVKNYIFALANPIGEVLERLKRHAWKACIRQKRITGSNPVLSAKWYE